MNGPPGRWTGDEIIALAHETEVMIGAEVIESTSQDFGHIEGGRTRAVVRPQTPEEVRRLVTFAHGRALPLAIRGRGWSQSGQSLIVDGVVLETCNLNEVTLSDDGVRVTCGPGASWRRVLEATAKVGRRPRVLPLNLDISVGGLLSVGGIGSTSHRYGPAIAQVVSLEVVTGAGDRVRCSPESEPGLFDGTLSGLGRCGVIVSAELDLAPLRTHVRTFRLLYDELETWLSDQRRLVRRGTVDHMEAFITSSSFSALSTPSDRTSARAWSYEISVSFEYDDVEPSPDALLCDLSQHQCLERDDAAPYEFADRYAPRFARMKQTGAWEAAHPWVEAFLPADVLVDLLPAILDLLPPHLGDGHRVQFLAPKVEVPRFFMLPEADQIAALAILPTGVSPGLLDGTLEVIRDVGRRIEKAGGVRYLSGWLGRSGVEAFERHYRDRYQAWMDAKRRYDPAGVFQSVLFSKQEVTHG